jgi:3-oxoacyl-[acyl-carrier protein] reductase
MADSAASETDRRVVLITGAAGGGIGTATALKFARNGYRVVITDIVDLESTKRSVEGLGAECLAITMDVTDSKSVNEAVEMILRQWSRVRRRHVCY